MNDSIGEYRQAMQEIISECKRGPIYDIFSSHLKDANLHCNRAIM